MSESSSLLQRALAYRSSSSNPTKLKDATFKSLEGKQAMVAWQDKIRKRLGENAEEIWVKTRFGWTYLVGTGPKDAPVVFAIHGWGNNGMIWVTTPGYEDFTKDFRVYTIDVIGQPGQSALQTPPIRSDGYAEWLKDVMDELEIEKAIFLGTSFGGWLTVKFGLVYPEHQEKAILLCPAGFSRLRWDPTLLYYLTKTTYFPTEKNTEQFVEKVILSPESQMDPEIMKDWVELFNLSFAHFQTEAEQPVVFSDEELGKLKTPTLLLIGEHDMLFAAEPVVERAKAFLPNLVRAEVVPKSGHGCENFSVFSQAMKDFLYDLVPQPIGAKMLGM